jgi:hypothetical protein
MFRGLRPRHGLGLTTKLVPLKTTFALLGPTEGADPDPGPQSRHLDRVNPAPDQFH